MNTLASPILLFAGSVIGALGIAMALPRRGTNPQIVGALVGALGLGVIFLALGLRSVDALPNFNFYLFSAIALGSALRVISHPRPVYAALYFILTILASSGLYVLLSAEFMAFALVIVYAGAILITYLFVIMLATESPTAEQAEALSDYDRYSREPVLATLTGFILVAGLTSLLAVGTSQLNPATTYESGSRLGWLPGKIQKSLIEAGSMEPRTERLATEADKPSDAPGYNNLPKYPLDVERGTITIAYGADYALTRTITRDSDHWPKDLELSNVEGVGFTLLADQPGGIEVAGIVLLMAMLGAVVLARKKVELDDQAKLEAQSHALIDEASEAALRATPRAGRGSKASNGHVSRSAEVTR